MSFPLPLTLYSDATQHLSCVMEYSRMPDCQNLLKDIHKNLLASLNEYSLVRRVPEKAKFYSRKIVASCQKYEKCYQFWNSWPSPETLELLQKRLEKMQRHLTRCEIYLMTESLSAQVLWYLDQAQVWALDPYAYSSQDAHLIFAALESAVDAYAKQRAFNLGIEIEARGLLADFRFCLDFKKSWDLAPDLYSLRAVGDCLALVRGRLERCEVCLVTRDLYKETLFCITEATRWVSSPGEHQQTLQQILSLIHPFLERYMQERAIKLGKRALYLAIRASFRRCIELQRSWNPLRFEDLNRLNQELRELKHCLRVCEGAIRSALCGY